MTKPQSVVGGTQVLRRVSEILRFVAAHNPGGARLSDVAGALQLELPTAHRLLQGLVAERMLVRNPDKGYVLGPDLWELGIVSGGHFGLLDFFRAPIARIVEATGDTVVLTVRSGNYGVCIDRRSGAFPIQANTVGPGGRRPLAAGAGGLAILSALPEDQCERIVGDNAIQLQNVPNKTASQLRLQLQKARTAGYVVHEITHTNPRITAVGVPVFGSYGVPIAGMSVKSIASRLTGRRRMEVAEILRVEANVIANDLSRDAGHAARGREEDRAA